MTDRPKIGCVILAAGSGSRFGGDKLSALFRGRPLYEHAIDAVPESVLPQTVVVSGKEDILRAAEARGLATVRNDRPELGISRSVRLGTEALMHCDGLLYMVGDQPLLSRNTVEMLINAFIENFDHIIAPIDKNEQMGNPCLFPARFFPELCALEGDRGGKRVIRAHPEAVRTVTVPPQELIDTDSREALAQLEQTHI